ncbi:MAG: hypothetical protein AAFW73_27010, partial [Bacteroidota bacterium]
PSQSANFAIVNADPYFSSSLGSRPVNGNGLDGKELMWEILCNYPEQPDQSNTLWQAAIEAADAQVGGQASIPEIWSVFARLYLQQKQRVIALQKKNPCDSDKYSPYLYDASTENAAADLFADLPRQHAFNFWSNTTYGIGGGTQPASGIHPVYDNWDQSCNVQTSTIPQVSELLNNWSYGDNEQLRVMDERAVGFAIRVPDVERIVQDLVDGGNNDGIFGAGDDWPDLVDGELNASNPCTAGAAVLIDYIGEPGLSFPASGGSIAFFVEKTIRYCYDDGNTSQSYIINNGQSTCSNLLADPTAPYYSVEDFYGANQDFFDCMVASVNDFTSIPYDFQATHTPTHFVITSPTHVDQIPDGATFTTYGDCSACGSSSDFNGGSNEENHSSTGTTRNRNRSQGQVQQSSRSAGSTPNGGCYTFLKPCEQIVPHCLCEHLNAARNLTTSGTTAQIAALYASEYGGNPIDWEPFIGVLLTQCDDVIYDAEALESAQVAAEAMIEDLADGVVDLPSSPNAPAPIALDCFELEPDPCDEGQTIADYYNETVLQDQVDALLEAFAENYTATCLSGTQAPDALQMVYEDREYHFTLYYYSPEGNLYATVPPEGVRPISESDPTVFDQIASIRDAG